MKNLSSLLLTAKNQLGQSSPWLFLIDLNIINGPTFRLVNNNEDVPFNGITYSRFPFTINPPQETSKGQITSAQLVVSNVTRVIQAPMEALGGGIGSTVRWYVVNAGLLTENYADLTLDFDVISAECTATWITFGLGAPSPLRRRFPLHKYIATHCNWQFKSAECAYSGTATACDRMLATCETLGNTARFGGFPGLQAGGLKLA